VLVVNYRLNHHNLFVVYLILLICGSIVTIYCKSGFVIRPSSSFKPPRSFGTFVSLLVSAVSSSFKRPPSFRSVLGTFVLSADSCTATSNASLSSGGTASFPAAALLQLQVLPPSFVLQFHSETSLKSWSMVVQTVVVVLVAVQDVVIPVVLAAKAVNELF